MKHLTPIERGLVWFGVFWIAAILFGFALDVLAASEAVIEEAEKDGIQLLYAALASAVTLVAGWFAKRPQDLVRERRNGNGGAKADVVAEALKTHEAACEKREAITHKRIDHVKEELGLLRAEVGEQGKTLARMEGRLAHFMDGSGGG